MTINANTVSASEARAVLDAAWSAQQNGAMTSSWMLHGPPGIGKTQIVQDLAKARGAQLFDLRLTTIEPQDLRGLPYYDHDTKRTVWYRPEDLPDDPKRPSLLFLDELTAAAPSLQPTVYGLLQERRVGRHDVPPGCLIVAAGNMVEDGAVAYEMGSALSDRLVHMVLRADAVDWLQNYAVPKGLHPAVTSFIRARPDLLETGEEALRRGFAISCTPRAWERVSQILHAVPDRVPRNTMIAGSVGAAVAAEFALVADEIEALVQIDEMLTLSRRDRTALYPASLHGLTALTYGVIGAATAETLDRVIEVIADIRHLEAEAFAGLPLAELTSFGFEILVRKGLDHGWQSGFAASEPYRAYARERQEAGLP